MLPVIDPNATLKGVWELKFIPYQSKTGSGLGFSKTSGKFDVNKMPEEYNDNEK